MALLYLYTVREITFNYIFISGWSLDHFERFIGPRLPTEELGIPPIVGQSLEGGAKRRILAIGNYINQRLLSPIHDWLMRVLARIPTDRW